MSSEEFVNLPTLAEAYVSGVLGSCIADTVTRSSPEWMSARFEARWKAATSAHAAVAQFLAQVRA